MDLILNWYGIGLHSGTGGSCGGSCSSGGGSSICSSNSSFSRDFRRIIRACVRGSLVLDNFSCFTVLKVSRLCSVGYVQTIPGYVFMYLPRVLPYKELM